MTDEQPDKQKMAYNIFSFAQLEAEENARKTFYEMQECVWAFGDIASNIFASDMDSESKLVAMKALLTEFDVKVTEALAMKEKGFFEKALNTIEKVLGKKEAEPDTATVAPTGFMLLKESSGATRWMAIVTNNLLDNDSPREILAKQAHERFVERLEKSEVPYPELWVWHNEHWPIGKADFVALKNVDDITFVISSGTIHPGQEKLAQALVDAGFTGVSHGMPRESIRRDVKERHVIVDYTSREISILPPSTAANPYTGFVITQ